MNEPSNSSGKKRGKRAELAAWIGQRNPARIGETEFAGLLRDLAPVNESYLRKLLRESGVPLDPMVEGVRQGNLDELESTLLALLQEYEHGDRARRSQVRRLIITAKDHARWAAAKNPQKKEMLLWLLTWLENPPVFREWARLRRAHI